MKKQQPKRLALGRETLAPLQHDALDRVGGGVARTLTWTCPYGGTKDPI